MTYEGPDWSYHTSGYEAATFPVMPDVKGEVYVRYGADAYDVFLIDREGRIASRFVGVYDALQYSRIMNKLRDLHAE